MTDLQQFVEAAGRDDAVAAVRKKIAQGAAKARWGKKTTKKTAPQKTTKS